MFSFKNLTVAQAVVLVTCLVAPIAAYKLLGSSEAAAATAAVGTVMTFLLGRQDASSTPPGAP